MAALGTTSSTIFLNLAEGGGKGGGGEGRKEVFVGEEGRGMMGCFLCCFGLFEEGGGAEKVVGKLLSFAPTLVCFLFVLFYLNCIPYFIYPPSPQTTSESVKLFFFLSKWLELHFDTLVPPPPSLPLLFKGISREIYIKLKYSLTSFFVFNRIKTICLG